MVTFACDACQEIHKKAKLDAHAAKCRGARFSCLDCNTSFSGDQYRNHTTCISEAEKYQKTNFVKNKTSALSNVAKKRCINPAPIGSDSALALPASLATPLPASLATPLPASPATPLPASPATPLPASLATPLPTFLTVPFRIPRNVEKKLAKHISLYKLLKHLKRQKLDHQAKGLLKTIFVTSRDPRNLEMRITK
ncbi:zinc finger, C2H2, LYAR-type protein [Mitosporidium daphniae]|uniref:Zinc finger, C2H2, LYAR-type protein n=1 Tax=Mitosporidium daphniae TaxID=1485682 RepID=A0A098VN70_9MICR|nr:zinc finger, C2H2, LYAR-type protein [Mitosporidium daphniae]KGG50498.1 zinc finger, C2H2, LYAR-type protein [Mitosporidium daphniae]|eukprot:XP_013236945.1 zinc finger, C2H2, LYAR-type protein [Mitosporidium daphniae]